MALHHMHTSLLKSTPQGEAQYRTWGFTIYRTAYSSSSEEQWLSLKEKIYRHIRRDIESLKEKDDAHVGPILGLLRLDFRSDAALLDNAGMDQLRHVYKEATGGVPMNADEPNYRVFLFVDEESMASITDKEPWIKCVQVDYDAAQYVPRNRRVGGQRYYGWMKMNASSVFGLWEQLTDRDLYEIAPPTIGGFHLVVWDPDGWLA